MTTYRTEGALSQALLFNTNTNQPKPLRGNMSQEFFSATTFNKSIKFFDLSKFEPGQFEQYLSFASKEEYFSWRAAWRLANISVVARIRAVKTLLRQPHTVASRDHMWELVLLRHEATALRFLRTDSKRLAGRQAASARAKLLEVA